MYHLLTLPVAHVVVGGDGFWVVVDHDCPLAQPLEFLDAADGTPVELDRGADPVDPGSNHHGELVSGVHHWNSC